MDFDTIFTIFIVVIVFVSQLLKVIFSKKTVPPKPDQKKTERDKEKQPQTSGWKTSLNDLFVQLKKEIENAQEGGQRQEQTGWEHVMPKKAEPPKKAVPKKKTPPKAIPPAKSTQKLPGKQVSGKAPSLSGHTPPVMVRRRKRVRYTNHQLRQAVIWSEIFAPPLALREDSDAKSLWGR